MDIPGLLKKSKVIAVVGLSDDPERPSHDVASYLLKQGYRIIPVNPKLTEWEGIKAYPTLLAIPKKTRIDIVDIFRRSEAVPPIVDEAIAIGAKAVWMQLGVVNEDAAKRAMAAGLFVVMDRCMKIEHMGMNPDKPLPKGPGSRTFCPMD
ncbi:MAG: CoA-binding protein [Candidatus Micrarchaeota archaeon]